MFNVTIRNELDNVYRDYVRAIVKEDFAMLQSVSVGVLPSSLPESLIPEAFCYLQRLVPNHSDLKCLNIETRGEYRAEYYHALPRADKSFHVNVTPFRKVRGAWKVAGLTTPRRGE